MATDSIMGLFTDPNQLMQQQSAATDQRAAQFARMSPMEQAQYGIFGGASRIAGGAANLLGAEDPQMKLQSIRQRVLQSIDRNDPKALAEGAQALNQAGDAQGAQALYQAAQVRTKDLLEAEVKQSQITKNLRTSSTTVSERNREMISNAEIKLAKGEALTPEEEARVRWLVGQENKPKIFRDSDTGEITTIEPIDLVSSAPNLAKLVGKQGVQSSAQGAANAPAGVAGTATTTPATKLPASIRKEVGSVDEQLTTVDTSIKKITELTPKIQNLNLGLYQNIERGVSGFLGTPTPDTKEFKQLQREVRAQANNLLLLAKGTQTEGDAQRAKDQIADDDTWKNKELLTSAFDDLAVTLAGTKKAIEARRQTLTSSGIPAVPGFGANDVAPNKSPMSGMNPQLQPAEQPVTPQGKPLTQDLINKANDAIKRGAPRDAVMKRLKDQGYAVQ
jgi:hypothetical protein